MKKKKILIILQENTIIASKKNNYTFIVKNKHKYKEGDLDVTDKFGNTALYYAVSEGHYETVETLLKLGANVNCKNIDLFIKRIWEYSFA